MRAASRNAGWSGCDAAKLSYSRTAASHRPSNAASMAARSVASPETACGAARSDEAEPAIAVVFGSGISLELCEAAEGEGFAPTLAARPASAALVIATLPVTTEVAVRGEPLAAPDEDGTARAEASGPGGGAGSGKSTATMAMGRRKNVIFLTSDAERQAATSAPPGFFRGRPAGSASSGTSLGRGGIGLPAQ